LRYGQRIDAIVFGMGADELDEGDLPAEIERDHQAVIPSSRFSAFDLGAALWTSSIELQCAALMSPYQRSSATRVSGCRSKTQRACCAQ
jgi:hypothetical protein